MAVHLTMCVYGGRQEDMNAPYTVLNFDTHAAYGLRTYRLRRSDPL